MERWHPLRPFSGWSTLPHVALCVILLVVALTISPMGIAMHGPLLPRAVTAEQLRPGALEVGITEYGQVWIGDARVKDHQLAETIRDSLAARPIEMQRIQLLVDRDVPYSRAEGVLSAISAAGVFSVDLVVDCPRGRETYGRHCAAEPAAAPDAPRR